MYYQNHNIKFKKYLPPSLIQSERNNYEDRNNNCFHCDTITETDAIQISQNQFDRLFNDLNEI